MIDPLCEELISLRDAARLFPKNSRGKHPHVSAIYRYTTTGCRGVVLEAVQAGSVRSTTREAVARFIQELTTQVSLPRQRRRPTSQAAAEAGSLLDEEFFRRRQDGDPP